MPEEKRKINAWIPVSLYNQLESAGYDNITQALIKALESFGEDPQEDTKGSNEDIEGYKQDIEGYKQDLSRIQKDLDKQNQDIIGYIQDIKTLNNEIERLKEDLKRAPDLATFAQLQTRSEEQERHISFLKEVMEKAGQREEDLKQLHNNYMLQIQSLINARALMPSGSTEGEKPKKESKPAREKRESRYREHEERVFEATQDSPAIKESPDIEPKVKPEAPKAENNGLIEKTCKNCNETFFTGNIRKETCSDNCRSAYSKKNKKQ